MGFTGFPADALTFLADLAEHNDRAWFSANRERYEASLLGPEKAFIDALGDVFATVDPRVRCEPRVDRSIFRINRDTRFSNDKSPYKTHADVWLWMGKDRKHSPGYFVRIVPEGIWVGGGAHFMEAEQLARLRAAIDDGRKGSQLEHLMRELEAAGYEIGGKTRKRVPAGFSADHPRADLLLYTAVDAITVASPVPAEFYDASFVDWCVERFAPVSGLVDWLVDALGS